MRRKIKNKYPVQPEPVYESLKVAKLINYVMYDGKKVLHEKSSTTA
jgi:ribosomal protein S7